MEIFGIPSQALFGQLLIGLINGSFYALLSLGLAVIFGLLNIINFTHGAQYMLGAFVAYLGLTKLGINYWVALVVTPLVVGATGMLIERTMLKQLYKLDHLYGLLLTFGLALIIQGLFRNYYGSSGLPYTIPPVLVYNKLDRLEPGRRPRVLRDIVEVDGVRVPRVFVSALDGTGLDELRAVAPRCETVSNRVFVVDGPVSSSAGVTTGIDLFLHRIADLCGPALAAQVAQAMVVALRRGPNDPELSPFLRFRAHLHPAIHRVQDAIGQQPQADWSLQRMADVACTSPRHLARLFLTHAGIAPLAYLRSIRLDLADAALRSGHSVTLAAELAGFSSDTQLRRTWHQLGKAGSPAHRGH